MDTIIILLFKSYSLRILSSKSILNSPVLRLKAPVLEYPGDLRFSSLSSIIKPISSLISFVISFSRFRNAGPTGPNLVPSFLFNSSTFPLRIGYTSLKTVNRSLGSWDNLILQFSILATPFFVSLVSTGWGSFVILVFVVSTMPTTPYYIILLLFFYFILFIYYIILLLFFYFILFIFYQKTRWEGLF